MNHTNVHGIETPQFGEDDLSHADWDTGGWPWYFTAAMVSTCSPVLDACNDNYDVRDLLKKARVITQGNDEDSESCQMFVNFRDKRMGLSFIRRLNAYLVRKAEALADVAQQRRAVTSR